MPHADHDQRLNLIHKAEDHHRRYLELQEERLSLYPIIEAAVAECENPETDDSGGESPDIADDLPLLKHELEDLEMEAPITEFVDGSVSPPSRGSSSRESLPAEALKLLPEALGTPTGGSSLLRRLAAAERQMGEIEASRQEALAKLAGAEERELALLSRQSVMEEALHRDRSRRNWEVSQRRTSKKSVMTALSDGSLSLALASSAPRRNANKSPATRTSSKHFLNSKTTPLSSPRGRSVSSFDLNATSPGGSMGDRAVSSMPTSPVGSDFGGFGSDPGLGEPSIMRTSSSPTMSFSQRERGRSMEGLPRASSSVLQMQYKCQLVLEFLLKIQR